MTYVARLTLPARASSIPRKTTGGDNGSELIVLPMAFSTALATPAGAALHPALDVIR